MNTNILILAIISYLCGTIPFGLFFSKIKGIDLRSQGSGNIGATNVWRVMGWKYGAVVFFLDAFKGAVPTALSLSMSEYPYIHILIGILAIVGHSLPVFTKFKGGKGVATAVGVIFALAPNVALILLGFGLTMIMLTRYVAPVSILCALLAPILFKLLDYPNEYTVVMMIVAIFVIFRHKDNIKRMIHGTENKI